MADFKDHFSKQSADYAKYRPTYPPELFEFVASAAPAHDVCWDCATGNGQAARPLRHHFDRVIATDASAAQIANAEPADGIDYRVATAEDSGLGERSVDAVTVATAFHWLDHREFAREVRRVAKPGAIVAVWTYSFSTMPREPDEVIRELVRPLLAPHWAPQVQTAWEGYADLHFPFDEVPTPTIEIRRTWTTDQYLAYTSTWSAVNSCIEAEGYNPFEKHRAEIAAAWGPVPREIAWPLVIRAGRVNPV